MVPQQVLYHIVLPHGNPSVAGEEIILGDYHPAIAAGRRLGRGAHHLAGQEASATLP
jgi:hypothetical protein